jgi:hypothetical protein
MGVVGNVTPLISTKAFNAALSILFLSKTPATPTTVSVILQKLLISKEMTLFRSCNKGS